VDNDEARRLLAEHLSLYRAWSYQALCARIGSTEHIEVVGPSGVRYQIEIEMMWDNGPGANVMVIGSVDDGAWRAFVPLVDSFIKARDESFLGETPMT